MPDITPPPPPRRSRSDRTMTEWQRLLRGTATPAEYRFVSWTDEAATGWGAPAFEEVAPVQPVSRPRGADGRFLSAEEASVLRTGDIVRVSERPGTNADGSGSVASEFWGQQCVITGPYDMNRDLWTVRVEGSGTWGNTNNIHQNSLTLVRRMVSAPETPVPVFQRGDRVLIGDRARTSRSDDWFEPNAMNQPGEVTSVNVYGDGETYNVRLEAGRITHTVFAGSLTLLERDGVHVEGAPVIDRVISCENSYCARILASEDARITTSTYGRSGCADCTQTCSSCDDVHLSAHGSIFSINGSRVCSECSTCCDDCGTQFIDDGEGCPNWEDHDMPRGVHGYGHTTPSMWLGGPLKKKEDGRIDTSVPGAYYVGIELEVYASYEQSAMPIYDWAEQHLGHRDAIVCKEDSSVRGFEIVTQPMTPEMFESVDWESFMDLINTNHPLPRNRDDEPTEHGLHVHIGRIAFDKDDVAQAAYSYLLSQGDHLERIGRREAYHYCAKVRHPVSAHISRMAYNKTTAQTLKVQRRGIGAGRDAVNLQNDATIEIRAFRSTRNADYLRNAVRLTYVAAEYIRYLRVNREAVSPKSLHWAAFSLWVAEHYPEAHASIAGIEDKRGNRRVLVGASVTPAVNFSL